MKPKPFSRSSPMNATALVAELDEVAGGDAAAFDVVGHDHRDARAPGVDEHDGYAGVGQAGHVDGGREEGT